MYNFWEPISGLGMDRKTSSFWSQESLYWSRKLKFILNVLFPLISFAFLRKYTPKKSVLVPLLDLSYDIYLPLSSHQLHFPHSFFSSPLFPTYFLIWKSPTVIPSSIPTSVAPSVWSPGLSAAIFFHGHHCRHHTQGGFFTYESINSASSFLDEQTLDSLKAITIILYVDSKTLYGCRGRSRLNGRFFSKCWCREADFLQRRSRWMSPGQEGHRQPDAVSRTF